jgi:hypothetical protein
MEGTHQERDSMGFWMARDERSKGRWGRKVVWSLIGSLICLNNYHEDWCVGYNVTWGLLEQKPKFRSLAAPREVTSQSSTPPFFTKHHGVQRTCHTFHQLCLLAVPGELSFPRKLLWSWELCFLLFVHIKDQCVPTETGAQTEECGGLEEWEPVVANPGLKEHMWSERVPWGKWSLTSLIRIQRNS